MNRSRSGGGDADWIVFGPFVADRAGGVVSREGRDVPVPPKAIGVLLCLLERPGAVVSKEELLDAVWNGTAVTDGSLTEAVRTLRQALGDNPRAPRYIQTVHRRGYRLIAEVRPHPAGGHTLAGAAGAGNREMIDIDVSPGAVAPGGGTSSPTPGPGRLPIRAAPATKTTPARAIAAATLLGGLLFVAGYGLVDGLSAPRGSERLADDFEPEMTTIGPPPDRVFFNDSRAVAITPDGSSVIFRATAPGDSHHLYTHLVDGHDSRPLLSTSGRWAVEPLFVSPDGGSVGYLGGFNDSIEMVDLAGGTVRVLCERCPHSGGATMAADGTLYFATGGGAADPRTLMRLSPGGSPEPLDQVPAEPGADYLWPHLLPGEEWMLLTVRYGRDIEDARVAALNLETGERRFLIDDGFNARFVAGVERPDEGHLLFGRGGRLWAVGFDAGRIDVHGEAVPLPLEKPVGMSAIDGSAGYDVSGDGTLAYHPGGFVRREFALVAGDPEGDRSLLLDERAEYRSARVSPDGTRLAACVRAKRDEIRVYDLVATDPGLKLAQLYTLRNNLIDYCNPVWSPDGSSIALVAGGHEIHVAAARSRGGPNVLLRSDHAIELADWSPDGRIIYTVYGETGFDVWTADADCVEATLSRVPCAPDRYRPFLATEEHEVAGRLSPDGRWLAVRSGTETWTISALPFPHGGPPVPVAEGWDPSWAPDGSNIHYRAASGRMVAPWHPGVSSDPASIRPSTRRWRGTPQDMLSDGTLIAIDTRMPVIQTPEVVVVKGLADWLRRLDPAPR